MNVSLSYLNSINLRSADNPYSACFDGHRYVRRYLMGDRLRVQLVLLYKTFDDISASCRMLDRTGTPVAGSVAMMISESEGNGVLDIIVSGRQVGEYTLRVQLTNSSNGKVAILDSEPFCIVEEFFEKNVLIEVNNDTSNFGVFFDTVDVPFAFRVEGGFYPKSLQLSSNDTIYEGQQVQLEMLYSMPYETQLLPQLQQLGVYHLLFWIRLLVGGGVGSGVALQLKVKIIAEKIFKPQNIFFCAFKIISQNMLRYLTAQARR